MARRESHATALDPTTCALHTAETVHSYATLHARWLTCFGGTVLLGALIGACSSNDASAPGAAGAGQGGQLNRAGASAGSSTAGSAGTLPSAGAGGTALPAAGSGGLAGAATSGGPSLAGNTSGGAGGTGGMFGDAGHGGIGLGGTTSTGGTSGTGGASGTGGTSAYRPCPGNGSPCKIMPFGDSITDGYGSPTEGSYRIELFRLAHQAGKNITFVGSQSNGPSMDDGVPFPQQHEGHSGFTIYPTPSRSGISPFVDSSIPQLSPHIVTLMIGTNDAIDDYQMANAPTRLGMLIDSIFAKLPNVLLVVAAPIPSQDNALNTRLQTYGAAIPAIAKVRADAGKHILVVDMYAPFSAVADYKSSLLKDTWHPSVAGDVILGQRWYSVLAPSL
jgi:lysophospholipase L1-like esterase